VNAPLETVDGGDLSLASLVGAAHNGDLVVLADGDGANL
jgi:phage protein U